jgi:hypothetical protein
MSADGADGDVPHWAGPFRVRCELMGSGEQDRRMHARIKRRFTASFRLCGDGSPPVTRKWDIVTIRDLSVGGIAFNYHEKIPVGTALEFNIALPSSPDPVNCFGEVCRIDEPPQDTHGIRRTRIYGIAACFGEMPQETREALRKLAERFHSS